jgi:hypothetical protein
VGVYGDSLTFDNFIEAVELVNQLTAILDEDLSGLDGSQEDELQYDSIIENPDEMPPSSNISWVYK